MGCVTLVQTKIVSQLPLHKKGVLAPAQGNFDRELIDPELNKQKQIIQLCLGNYLQRKTSKIIIKKYGKS